MAHKPTKLELHAKSYMLAKFGDRHNPSPQQWRALDHILESLDRMRTGQTASKVFLSSIDPGVGKTVTLTSYLKAYLQHDDNTGALVCINSWREIEALLLELKPHLSDVAVWYPSGTAFNGPKMRREHRTKGLVSASELSPDRDAKILIATHTRISQEIHRHGSAATTSSLFYQGRPRAIRVWDESWLPTDPITVQCSKLFDAMSTLSSFNQPAYQVLSEFLYNAENSKHNATLSFPSLSEDHGLTFDSVDENLERFDVRQGIREVLYLLVRVSGLTVSIYSDGDFGNTALTFEDTSPFAMAPLLVLDASGRVQDVYRDLIERDVVHPLRSATKDYSPLEISIWERGGGKSSFNPNKLDHLQITEEIIKLIEQRPDERWLIVCHKDTNHFIWPVINIGPAICQHFGSPDNIKFITWGQHRASNEFVEYENIILAGLLYLREAQYAALKRVSLGLRPEHDGDLPSALIAKVRLGEHMNNILQALCRVRVRQSDDHMCLPARAYLIAPRNSGLKRHLPSIFPGLGDIQSWGRPEKLELTAYQKRTGRHVVQHFMTSPGIDRLHISSTARALGFDRLDNFKRDVRDQKAFRVALEAYGVHEWGKRKSQTHWEVFDRSLLPEATLNHFFSQGHPA